MLELSKLKTGVPYRQQLETFKGHMHDNFYLLRGTVVRNTPGNNHIDDEYYLFTTKEIVMAVRRYVFDSNSLPDWKGGLVTGYCYPVTYHNRSGVLTSRHLFKFESRSIVGLEVTTPTVCGLFSSREMKRAKERVRMYINPILWTRLMRSVKDLFRGIKELVFQ